jgi:hypothetical protein
VTEDIRLDSHGTSRSALESLQELLAPYHIKFSWTMDGKNHEFDGNNMTVWIEGLPKEKHEHDANRQPPQHPSQAAPAGN